MYTLPSLEIWQGSYPFSYPQDVLGMLLADLDNTHGQCLPSDLGGIGASPKRSKGISFPTTNFSGKTGVLTLNGMMNSTGWNTRYPEMLLSAIHVACLLLEGGNLRVPLQL